jgi:hypothetical protein
MWMRLKASHLRTITIQGLVEETVPLVSLSCHVWRWELAEEVGRKEDGQGGAGVVVWVTGDNGVEPTGDGTGVLHSIFIVMEISPMCRVQDCRIYGTNRHRCEDCPNDVPCLLRGTEGFPHDAQI